MAFHWHGDAFTLPRGAVPLASSTMTPVQAFRFGARAFGVQFHLETDEEVLSAMLQGEEELVEVGVEPEALRAQATRELPRLRGLARPNLLPLCRAPPRDSMTDIDARALLDLIANRWSRPTARTASST